MSDAKPQKLIVVMAFDRDVGEVGPSGEALQFESEDHAKRKAAELADEHAGVIAWSRDAQPDIGEYGDPIELARYADVPELEWGQPYCCRN